MQPERRIGPRGLGAAAEGMDHSPGAREAVTLQDLEGRAVAPNQMQHSGEVVVARHRQLSAKGPLLARQAIGGHATPAVEAQLAQANRCDLSWRRQRDLERLEGLVHTVIVQRSHRPRMHAERDVDPLFLTGQLPLSPPAVRPDPRHDETLDAGLSGPLDHLCAVVVERRQVQVAVGVEHGRYRLVAAAVPVAPFGPGAP